MNLKIYKLTCKCCNNVYNLFLTENDYYKHKYSEFCNKSCARRYATLNVKHNDLKPANCIICNKEIFIKKNASYKTCKCNDCKQLDYLTITCIVCGKQFKSDKRKHRKTCSEDCSKIY